MQLRGNSRIISDESLEITDRDYLEYSIDGIQSLLAEEFEKLGLIEVEVSNNNIESITEMLPNFSCFLLGRLTTLVDLHKELYGDDRMLPWVKKPRNN